MNEAGRIQTPPPDAQTPPSSADVATTATNEAAGYDSLLSSLASVTEGFTGAELAGLVRAAASYALERAVGGGSDNGAAAAECRVTAEDFGRGLADVLRSKPSSDQLTGSSTVEAAAAKVFGWEPRVDEAVSTVDGEEGPGAGLDGSADDGSGAAAAGARSAGKSTRAAAAAVAATRLESDIGGNLSQQVKNDRNAICVARCGT